MLNPALACASCSLPEQMTVAPFSFDCLQAKLAEQAGFHAVYMTGFGTSAARGFPDLGLLTMSEMAANVRAIANAVKIPLIADADTGYGNPMNVWRTVREYEDAGAAATAHRGPGFSQAMRLPRGQAGHPDGGDDSEGACRLRRAPRSQPRDHRAHRRAGGQWMGRCHSPLSLVSRGWRRHDLRRRHPHPRRPRDLRQGAHRPARALQRRDAAGRRSREARLQADHPPPHSWWPSSRCALRCAS